MPKPNLILHAGAGNVNPKSARAGKINADLAKIHREGLRMLKKKSALETVVWTVCELENHPETNAGFGSRLQKDGYARLSASIMDGSKKRFAATSRS